MDEDLGKAGNIAKLELRGPQVTELPKDLIAKGKYPNLKALSLLQTHITSLEGISAICLLTVLDLSGCVTLCQGDASGLSSLKELASNRLQTLVLAFCGLSAEAAPSVREALTAVSEGLEVLRLEGNSGLGDALSLVLPSSLPKLHRLSCSMCSLKQLPSNLLQISPNLSILKAASNELSSGALACFSSSPAASKLTEISLEDNFLCSEDLRPLATCTALQSMDISNNKNIDSISTLTCLSSLTLLIADGCSITSLPLPPLTSPPSAPIFSSMTRISLRRNRIENGSGNWLNFSPNIQSIDLANNNLTSWPLGVESLTNLSQLRLGSNSISSLPSTSLINDGGPAAIMPCLETLDLSDNLLTGGPAASLLFNSFRFPALHQLDLSRNFLDDSIYKSLAVALGSSSPPSLALPDSPPSSPSIRPIALFSSSPSSQPMSDDDSVDHFLSSSEAAISFHPLRKLDLGFNRFTSLPPKADFVDKLPILETLVLDGNLITSSSLAQVQSASTYAPQLSQLCLHYSGLTPEDFPPNFIPRSRSQAVAVNYNRGVAGPSEILPNFLYLGSALDASCYRVLKQKNISHILTIACGLRPRFPDEFKYHCIDIEDEDEADLYPHFGPCHDLIKEAEQNATAVLVHCRAGVSRSATIVLSYLMKHCRLSYDNAFKHTYGIRSAISPNEGFKNQLRFFEQELRKEGVLPPL